MRVYSYDIEVKWHRWGKCPLEMKGRSPNQLRRLGRFGFFTVLVWD